MPALDIAIVLAFVAYAVGAGLRARKVASEDLTQYFLAGRSLPGWKAGMSMAATQFAADTPLLVTGLVATAGVFSLWRLWVYALAFLLVGFLLAPCWRRAAVLTDAELTEVRYGARPAAVLRGVKAVYFGLLFNCTVLAWVLFAAVRLCEPFLLWQQWLPPALFEPVHALVAWAGVSLTVDPTLPEAEVLVRSAQNLISLGLIVGFTLLYSTTGGLRGVVATDTVQLALMLLGTAVFAGIVIDRVGGPSALPARLGETLRDSPTGLSPDQMLAFDPGHATHAPFALLVVTAVQWLAQVNADGTGYLAQRSMACRTDRDAQVASVVLAVLQILLRSLFWLPLAVGLFVLFPPDVGLTGEPLVADREATYVRGMAELLPTGVRGLLLTAMLAALASTIDTHLNWGASYVTNDLYGRLFCRGWLGREPSPRRLVWVARASNLFILALALLVMTQLGSIAGAWTTSLLFGAGLGGVLVLRWLWWRVTARAELVAVGVSLVLAPLALATIVPASEHAVSVLGVFTFESGAPPLAAEATRLLFVAGAATTAAVLVAALGRPEPMGGLATFYARVRPPGFWRPVALHVGADPARDRRRLARGLAAVAVTAASLFSLLVGFGTLLLGSPPPPGVPLGLGWPFGLLALGVALWPLGWRLGIGARGRELA